MYSLKYYIRNNSLKYKNPISKIDFFSQLDEDYPKPLEWRESMIEVYTPNVLIADLEINDAEKALDEIEIWSKKHSEIIRSTFPVRKFTNFRKYPIGFMQEINIDSYVVPIQFLNRYNLDENYLIMNSNGKNYWNLIYLSSLFFEKKESCKFSHRTISFFHHPKEGILDINIDTLKIQTIPNNIRDSKKTV